MTQLLSQICNRAHHCGSEDVRFESAAICLQELTPEIVSINKSLKIDCKRYDDNGEPVMLKDNYGILSPCEIIPDELRIEE